MPKPRQPKGASENNDALATKALPIEDALTDVEDIETLVDDPGDLEPGEPNIGASAAIISICTIISRITGFIRTWAMAFALGSSLLSSAYQVANNLPNMLYELVIGGMLVAAFLPVYISVRNRLGDEEGNRYASNLFTIIIIALGIVSAVCIVLPGQIMYTQSFLTNQDSMTEATFFFRIFAIELVFYGLSSLLSGLLNAHRDYFWSSIAPVFNNVVVIASFVVYPFIAPHNFELALYIIAIGMPVAVFVQFIVQWPALKKNGIKLRLHINLRDPALRETLSIGLPTVFVMLCSFAVVSVQNATTYSFSEAGPSIIAYSRLWYTFPYSFLVVPITTTMFTELSNMYSQDNIPSMKKGIISGTNQIMFLMIPFALYLIVFAEPLVTLYHVGAFTMDSVNEISVYLAALAISLPLYGVTTYLQKIFSTIRHMKAYSVLTLVATLVQCGLMVGCALTMWFPIWSVALTSVVFYALVDIVAFILLRHYYGSFDFLGLVKVCLWTSLFGLLGAGTGALILWVLQSFVAPIDGSLLLAIAYILIGGIAALIVTFGLAFAVPSQSLAFVRAPVQRIVNRVLRRQTPGDSGSDS